MIAETLLFLLGIHFSIMLLAACYRIIDLWYRIGDYIVGISARIVALAMIDTAIYLVLKEDWQMAFIAGQIAYLVFHIVLFLINRFVIKLMESRYR